MDRGKLPSTGRGGKSKAPQHPQDIFALGSKSTVVVSRDSEKRNIHKPSTSAERKREPSSYGSQPPSKRSRIESTVEAVGGTSLEVDPVDLVPNVLQALDTHNSDKLLGLLTGSIRLLKSQRSKPDPILCMSMLYLTRIRPNMFAHDVVTQSLCTLLKREQGAAFKSKGNPLVFVLACNMLYAGHRDSTNWPDTFIKVYIEDALNERWWVDCTWCKCLVDNIVTAFNTKHPPSHLIPTDNTLGTMSPSGSGSPLMGSTDEDSDNTELEYTVFPRYSSSYETVEAIVLEAIKDQIQRRAAPDTIGKGFLKLLSATCGFPEIRMIAASRLEAWLHSGKLWRCGQELLAGVCVNCEPSGPTAARDHEVLAQLARMRLKTKPLQAAYQACLREMVSENPLLLGSVVTHTIYNELSAVRSPHNMAVLAALLHAQPHLVPSHMATTYQELLFRPEDYLRPLRALTRECGRAARADGPRADGPRADGPALLALVRALLRPPHVDPPQEVRERAFTSIIDLVCCCCMVTASLCKSEARQHLASMQAAALTWLSETAPALYRAAHYQPHLNKIMFVEPVESYTKVDNWPPESERALIYRICCETPLPQNSLLRIIFMGLSKEIPIAPTDVFELVEQLVRRACALPPEDNPLQVDKLEIVDCIFQLCQFNPPDNITLPAGYNAGGLCITSLYWRAWLILVLLAAHNPRTIAERASQQYPTLRALLEYCITGKASIEWSAPAEAERAEAERASILALETHLAGASNAKLPVTEHNSRLLSQLTTLEPLGGPRKPPGPVLEQLQQLCGQLRLGRLLCRQPALLLELVQRHGTRRAMPWLHHLLRQDQLELSVLPVQCLCEFLCGAPPPAPAGAGVSALAVARHVRRVCASPAGARAVLSHYMSRLGGAQRDSAMRGLKLVLNHTDETTELDFTGDASPESWLPSVRGLRQWAAVREEVVAWIRRACLADCWPDHLAAYIAFLRDAAGEEPTLLHDELALDLSQVLMERGSVISRALPPPELEHKITSVEDHKKKHATLHALTTILYNHLKKVRVPTCMEPPPPPAAPCPPCPPSPSPGEAVTAVWAGHRANMQLLVAHAHLKLLCYGPSDLDTNQEMYSYLESVWVGADPPRVFHLNSDVEADLLPDWLRLQLVRSERTKLLDAGIRGLQAAKLALFIQTFGMPVRSMSALLTALDACPAGAVSRLGVERGYMSQLLCVQAGRGAVGGGATAAALRLQPPHRTTDENLFEEQPLPRESSDIWSALPTVAPPPIVPSVRDAMFASDHAGFTDLLAKVGSELKSGAPAPRRCVEACLVFLQASAGSLAPAQTRTAILLRALLPTQDPRLVQIGESLLKQFEMAGGPVLAVAKKIVSQPIDKQPGLPAKATREQLIAAFEATTPSTLESVGNRIIETQEASVIVDVITVLLQRNQQGYYENKVKSEESEGPQHVLSRRGLGCGLLLDWLAELQREGSAGHTDRQMQLMFQGGCAAWRPLLVALLAHRASCRTLHCCLTTLLQPARSKTWSPVLVLEFTSTVVRSGRVCPAAPPSKHGPIGDLLSLSHQQLKVLIGYVLEEGLAAEVTGGTEAMRKCMENRLDVVLRCAPDDRSLLAAALPAKHPMLFTLLCMKVPKIQQLVSWCSYRRGSPPARGAAPPQWWCPSPADTVVHTLLTQLGGATDRGGTNTRWSRLENSIRALWSRVEFSGARALPLAGALLRGGGGHFPRRHHHLLAALEILPDDTLFAEDHVEEFHSILECLIGILGASSSRDNSLSHRSAALLRRYMASRPQAAQQLINSHRETLQGIPIVWSAVVAESSESWSSPPPHALQALHSTTHTPDNLTWLLQELETWVSRRGAGWGSGRARGALLRAGAALAGHRRAGPRHAAIGLLARLLPAATDTTPGVEAILECLESPHPDVTQAMLDKLPELIVGIQEHATKILMKVFELGITSRLPVDTCISKCVATLNLNRGC